MLETCKIYTLEHPETGEIRYIGKTEELLSKRLTKHIYESKHKVSRRNSWIKSLLKQELRPVINLLEEVPSKDWEFYERFWISQFKCWGFNLVNTTDGGESVYRKGQTYEQKYGVEAGIALKKKLSESQKRLYKSGYVSPTKGKVGELNHLYGKKRSKQAIENFIAATKGRKNTNKSIENIRNSKLGDREIHEITKEGKTLRIFKTITEIVETYEFKRQSILDVLCGVRKSNYGRSFKYIKK